MLKNQRLKIINSCFEAFLLAAKTRKTKLMFKMNTRNAIREKKTWLRNVFKTIQFTIFGNFRFTIKILLVFLSYLNIIRTLNSIIIFRKSFRLFFDF